MRSWFVKNAASVYIKARNKSACKGILFRGCKGELNKDLRDRVSGRWQINIAGALILKYCKTHHRTVRSYLVGPTILIYNPDVLKNAILSVLPG